MLFLIGLGLGMPMGWCLFWLLLWDVQRIQGLYRITIVTYDPTDLQSEDDLNGFIEDFSQN